MRDPSLSDRPASFPPQAKGLAADPRAASSKRDERGGPLVETAEVVAGRYVLKERLARGGMGEVFVAFDRSKNQRVALKRMLKGDGREQAAQMHFMREYHTLSELRHPRIIEVHDYGLHAGAPYYTMELLDGRDASDLAPLPYKEACRYLHDVASSLSLLHARKLLHRDVSPRNVRCTSDGHCKLIDFGTMMPFGQPRDVAGTPPCVPPEALQGAPLDQRSDLYALGALSYWLLTGRHARDVRTFEDLVSAWQKPLLRPRRLLPELPEKLDELIVALLAVDRERRPTQAAAVADAFAAYGEITQDASPELARAFFSSAELVGRGALLGRVSERLDATLVRRGAAVMLTGEIGVGKSRVLHEACVLAQTRGFLVVRAQSRHTHGAHALTRELLSSLRSVAPEQASSALSRFPALLSWLDGARDAQRSGGYKPVQDFVAESRAQRQDELCRLFCEIAQQRPLVIAVDDVDHADELSASLLAALSVELRSRSMMLVCTRGEAEPSRAREALLQTLTSLGAVETIEALSAADTERLVHAIFDAAPNIDRVNDWLRRAAHGNPGMTLSLAQHLFDRGVVKYISGTWVLPGDEITEPAPASLMQALALRLRPLSPSARELAELIALRRGSLSLSLCAAASGQDPNELLSALAELQREEIVQSAGDDAYVFIQEGMREAVRAALSPERVQELHTRLGHALLREDQSEDDLETRLEAGWHLLHTQQELAGADILAKAAPMLVLQGQAFAAALPAIEKALEVYDRHGRPMRERMYLRMILMRASYTFDYRLERKHAAHTLQLFYEHTGLALADALWPKIGQWPALFVAIVLTEIRRWFRPAKKRGPFVITTFIYFVRSVVSVMGVYATALDGPKTAKLMTMVKTLAPVVRLFRTRAATDACEVFALQPLGSEAALHDATQRALVSLSSRAMLMSEIERRDLLIGLLVIDAINECYKEHSQALARAATLDAIGTSLAVACAHRVRMVYYVVRGNRERTEHYRRLLDLHAIQGGTTWQVEWFSVPIEGIAGAFNSDVLSARRALLRLESLVREVPSLLPLRDMVQIGYHYRRGEFQVSVTLGERFLEKYPPRSVIGWGPTYAAITMALVEVGHYDRARELCERALSSISEADRKYFIMYAPIEAAYASVLLMLGQVDESNRLFETLQRRLENCGEPASAVLMHEMRARMQKRVGDREGYLCSLDELRRAAIASGQPSIVMFADAIAAAQTRFTYDSTPPMMVANARARERKDDAVAQTAVTQLLVDCRDDEGELTKKSLQLVADASDALEGYLYLIDAQTARLVAALQDRPPPSALAPRVLELCRTSGRAGMLRLDQVELGRPHTVIFLRDRDQPSVGPIAAAVLDVGSNARPSVPDSVLQGVASMLARRSRQPLSFSDDVKTVRR